MTDGTFRKDRNNNCSLTIDNSVDSNEHKVLQGPFPLLNSATSAWVHVGGK